jgi:hypothetical protein
VLSYRSDVDTDLLRHEGHDRRLDFAPFWKPSVRSEEKQKHGKGHAIGLALTSDADMILWSEHPCVDRNFRIVRWLAH